MIPSHCLYWHVVVIQTMREAVSGMNGTSTALGLTHTILQWKQQLVFRPMCATLTTRTHHCPSHTGYYHMVSHIALMDISYVEKLRQLMCTHKHYSIAEYIGVQGWLSGSLVMMQNKSYGMFWVQTQPCTPKQLEKKKCCH